MEFISEPDQTNKVNAHAIFSNAAALILILACCACGDSNESIRSLGEYDTPIEAGGNLKIYTYVAYPEHDTIVHKINFQTKGDGVQLTQFIYANGFQSYERYYYIKDGHKKLLKEFFYGYPGETLSEIEKTEGVISYFRETNKNAKYPGLELKIGFTNSLNFKTIIEETDEYIGDTIINWRNEPRPAIKFRYQFIERTFIRFLPFLSERTESVGATYYVKGVGFVSNLYKDDEGNTHRLELISVENESIDSARFSLP
jgi:hypothetical protein